MGAFNSPLATKSLSANPKFVPLPYPNSKSAKATLKLHPLLRQFDPSIQMLVPRNISSTSWSVRAISEASPKALAHRNALALAKQRPDVRRHNPGKS